MQLNVTKVKDLRQSKGWTQQQLADVASLSLRTVQRIENQGVASNESVNALCAVFEVKRVDILTPEESESLQTVAQKFTLRTQIAFILIFVFGIGVGSITTFVMSAP